MAEATTIRKAVRKLSPTVERIKSVQGEELESALRDFHVIIEEIREAWVPGEISGEDENVVEIVGSIAELRTASPDAFYGELDHVLSFITNSPDLWTMKLEEFNSDDSYESIMELLLEDRPLRLDEKTMEMIFRAARALDRYTDTAIYLSRKNRYYEPLFRALVEGDIESQAKTSILNGFTNHHNEDAVLAFLYLLKYDRDDIWARLRIVEVLEKRSKGDLISELESFPFERITELQEFRNLGYLLMRNDLPETSMMMISSALKLFPEDYELLKIKAEALLRMDEKVESYEIFKQLAVRNNSDIGVIKNAINLAYEQKLFDECQNIIETYPESRKDPSVMARKVECELQTSKFTEAIRDLDQALAEHPEDEGLLDLKLKALIKLNKESEAFNLARELMEKDPENDEATSYAMNWLYKRGEYETIVNLCEDNDILKHKYKPLFVACQIYEDEFKDALRELAEDSGLLNTPQVTDAIFFNVRDDDFISKLDAIYAGMKEKKVDFRTVDNRLRVIMPTIESLKDSVISENDSQAVAYIVSYEYYSSRTPEVPDRIRSMLYQPIFKEIRAMMEFMTSFYEGKYTEDVVDSPRYLFPLTEAYIKLGLLDRAESQLMRTTHSEDDPFYRYSMSMIDFNKGEYNSARKYIESAMDRLRNADFLKLALNVAVLSQDAKKFREYLDEILEMNLIDTFDFSELYLNITRSSLWDMASILVGIETEGTVRNPWIARLKRDLTIQISDFKKALDTSAVLFSTNQYLQEDVYKHIEILDKMGKTQDIINFLLDLETENKSIWLQKMIGDSYYRLTKYGDALVHYTRAISFGAFPEDIENYIDTLIEAGKFEESAALVEKTDNKLLLLKLYQKTSNIPAAIELLKKLTFKKDEDQEIVRYAADNLWYNTDVREFLINLYKQEGYTWLGKIIAIRTFENKDTKLSLEVARNLNKNNPEDLDIVGLYSNLLIRAGLREDAIQLILSSLKFCGDFSRCMNLTNTLLRLYYEDRDYESVIKFYETNPKYVDERSLQYVIRSYMEADNFDLAEKLMSRYEGTLISKDIQNELREDLKTKKEFMETIFYVSRLLKLEYKIGKIFDKKEAFYKADIPIEQIDPVYQFLNSRDFYFDVNEEKYEVLTRDVIQKAVKNFEMESLRDLKINVIYNNLERKDAILARNIYIYIKDQMDIARRPKLKDEALLKLLRIALRENIKQETLHIAFNLRVGVSEALEVMTLMEYMSKMNQEGEI